MAETTICAQESKVVKVPKPKTEVYQAKIASERKAIDALYKQMNELSAKVTELRSKQSGYTKQRDELRQNQDSVAKHIQDLETERAKLFAEIDMSQRTGRDMKSKVQSLKRNLGFQSAEEIDAKVRALERHMMSKRLSVPEENRLIAQIKQLKANKPLVSQYASMEADAESHSQIAVMPLKIRFDEVREELRVCQQKRRDLTERVRALMEENQQNIKPVRELTEERERLKKEVALHRLEETRLIDELNTKSLEYQAHLAEQQKVSLEKRREERRKRELDSEREQLQRELNDLEEDAWTPEYQLTNQTLQYLRKLVAKMNLTDEKPSSAMPSEQDYTAKQNGDDSNSYEEEGTLYRKAERTDDYYFAPTKKKADRKQRKQHVSLTQPLVHDLSTLADFEKLAIKPPLVLEDCPACLNILEKKMEVLDLEKQLLSQSTAKKKEELVAKLKCLEARA